MTALILYENNELSDLVTVSYPGSYNFEGKVAYLTDGVEISVEQLLEFLLVYSANDSAYATAMHISNSVISFTTSLKDQRLCSIGISFNSLVKKIIDLTLVSAR